jgi:hypothetical protein
VRTCGNWAPASSLERCLFNVAAIAPTPLYELDHEWVRRMWQDLAPPSSNAARYVNFMSEFQEDRVRAAYGPDKYALGLPRSKPRTIQKTYSA